MDDFLRLRQEQNSFNPSQATQNVHGLLDKIHERFSMTAAISTAVASIFWARMHEGVQNALLIS